jgi:hypothetical protein
MPDHAPSLHSCLGFCCAEYVPRQPVEVSLTAGPTGATLLVCPNATSDAALAAAEAAAAAAAATLDPYTHTCPTPEPQASLPDPAALAAIRLSEGGMMEEMLGMNPLARVSGGQGSLARVSGGRSPLGRRSTGHVSGGSNLERVSAGSATYVKEVGTSAASEAGEGDGKSSRSGGGVLLGSTEPLAGAIVDNRASVGVDLRRLHADLSLGGEGAAVGAVGTSSAGVGAGAAAVVGAVDGVGSGGSAAAAGHSPANPFRRSSSAKPLRCEARPTGERHL